MGRSRYDRVCGTPENKKYMAESADEIAEGQQIRELINHILSNGAYSDIMERQQQQKLDMARPRSLKVADPEAWQRSERERELIERAWKYRRHLADKALDTLERILDTNGF